MQIRLQSFDRMSLSLTDQKKMRKWEIWIFAMSMREFFPWKQHFFMQNKGAMRLCKEVSDYGKQYLYIVFVHVIIRNDIIFI